MPNLIQQAGAQYINDMCSGACFYYNNQLVQLIRASGELVAAERLDTGEAVFVPADFFTGWRVFASEPAGYRRLSEHVVAYCSKANSTRRGLRPDGIRAEYTPASNLLARIRTGGPPRSSNVEKVSAMIRPVYDNLDEALPRLLNGSLLSVVLNENLVIEAAVGQRADAWYSVLYKQAVIGKLSREGRVTWNDPEQSILIPSLRAA